MKIKYVIPLILMILIFAFPQRVQAQQIKLWYADYDEENEILWNYDTVEYEGELTAGIFRTFQQLFAGTYGGYTYPVGTEILYVNIYDSHLTLNISPEFKDYGGGSFAENVLLSQIMKTALDIEGVNQVTLLIDGLEDSLPEGTIIEEAIQWKDTIKDNAMQ